jgi:hypothetical protein
MTTKLRKIESREIRKPSTNELDAVTGGTSYPTLSLGGQSRVALQQELTAAYLAHNSSYNWGHYQP